MSTSPLSFDPYIINNLLGNSFLDVGCGHGKWGYLLKKYRYDKEKAVKVTGLDIFEPHLKRLKVENIYDNLYTGSASALPFQDKQFDSAVACEIIEHLPKAQGPILFKELKRVSRLSFVITTPNFSCLRKGGETLDGFNDFEAHLCNYSYNEFKSLGFTQIVGIGFKTPSFKISRAFSSLGHYFPYFSRYLIGFYFSDGKKRILEIE